MIPFVYTYRECLATLRAIETPGDVVVIWHPAHLPGIGQILVRNGYEPQEPRQWLTACHQIQA